MKAVSLVGVILIVLGILALIYQRIPYGSQQDVVRVGPIQTTVETRKSVEVPPIVGGLMLAGGVALVIIALKKKT